MASVPWLLMAVLGGAAAGGAVARVTGWDVLRFKALVSVLMMPVFVQQGALIRVSGHAILNPVRVGAEPWMVFLAHFGGPALVAGVFVWTLLGPPSSRYVAVLLPVAATAVTWWVSVPLGAWVTAGGWFTVPPVLRGVGVFAYSLAATCFIAGYLSGSGAELRGE
ncbi:MAG: hypothetical protein OEZ65_03455 [Gemmatimonadota bacterium]|nr:hypothetical protein [Gemmatimonadota bacterium]MDH5758619.1 hypothetical protein [Gemmatimonadota bacterium]